MGTPADLFRVWRLRACVPFVFVLLFAIAGCRSSHGDSGSGAASTTPPISASSYPFDGNEAYSYLTAQCDFGPRVPGTEAHQKCEQYILDTLRPNVDEITEQDFHWDDPDRGKDLNLSNILARINPTGKPKIMICAHWDTRPTADMDFNPENRDKPIPGADDGASGVAVLLELAKQFHLAQPKACVELAFWDAEDWGPEDDKMYVGAKYFSKHAGDWRPDEAILIDMIGQKDLVIPEEGTSLQKEPRLIDTVYTAAADLGYAAQFPRRSDYTITDDHDPLLDAGIPAIDLIDFNYPYWHTLDDTPDKCSPDSLRIVGRVLSRVIYESH